MNDPYTAAGAEFDDHQMAGWQETRRTSIAAILSLISSFIFCLPLLTQVLGIVFGLAGLISIARSEGRRKGTGLAIAGIIVSILVIAVWGLLGVGIYGGMKEVGTFPSTMMKDIMTGNTTNARAKFAPTANKNIGDAEITAFRSQLESEFGEFKGSEFDWSFAVFMELGKAGKSRQYQNVIPFPISLRFEHATVSTIFEYERDPQAQPQPGDLPFMFRRVTILSPDGSIWEFPAGNSGGSSAPSNSQPGDNARDTPTTGAESTAHSDGDNGGG